MPTMAQAIRAYVQSIEEKVTSDQIKEAITTQYPDQWKSTTLQAHLYACVVNNPKAYIHHPSTQKFLYRHSDGSFEIYDENVHGPNEWAPPVGDDDVTDLGELAETSISLERDIEDHLVHNLSSIEPKLKLVQRQAHTDVGRVDILAEDGEGTLVVMEVKVGEAKDSAIGQVARYMGWYSKSQEKPVRSILIASDFPEGVQYAASVIPNLTLLTYRVNFSFEKVSL